MAAGGRQLPFALLAHSLVVPGEYADWDQGTATEDAEVDLRDPGTGSRAVIRRGDVTVVQTGPRRLWDEIEGLYDRWIALGAPARERFGLTVAPNGTHTLWLDRPEGPNRWDATPPR